MKNQTSNKPAGLRKKKAIREAQKARQAGENLKSNTNDDLLVIRDAYSHKEYYLSVIDSFLLQKSEYFVMYNFVPDNGSHTPPELVIMRAGRSPKGDQILYSIKDKDELDRAFVCFMRRFYASRVPDDKTRNGVASAESAAE
ncbi:MAG: DUF1292 domain-containing protein [Saccharofermentans sp.]|nr:DUF1292 domain-containing protein [Saccharofermentans sp.]